MQKSFQKYLINQYKKKKKAQNWDNWNKWGKRNPSHWRDLESKINQPNKKSPTPNNLFPARGNIYDFTEAQTFLIKSKARLPTCYLFSSWGQWDEGERFNPMSTPIFSHVLCMYPVTYYNRWEFKTGHIYLSFSFIKHAFLHFLDRLSEGRVSMQKCTLTLERTNK